MFILFAGEIINLDFVEMIFCYDYPESERYAKPHEIRIGPLDNWEGDRRITSEAFKTKEERDVRWDQLIDLIEVKRTRQSSPRNGLKAQCV